MRVIRVATPEAVAFWARGLANLLSVNAPWLCDARTPHAQALLANVAEAVPHLWLAVASSQTAEPKEPGGQNVLAGASLDSTSRRSAWLHGAALPCLRRHPAVVATALAALDAGFFELALTRVLVEADHLNPGAAGFCRRFGLTRLVALPGRVIFGVGRAQYVQAVRPRLCRTLAMLTRRQREPGAG